MFSLINIYIFFFFIFEFYLRISIIEDYVLFISAQFNTMKKENGGLTLADLPSQMAKLKHVGENLTEQDRELFLRDSYKCLDEDVDFELFLRVYIPRSCS